jgi:predicted ATPase
LSHAGPVFSDSLDAEGALIRDALIEGYIVERVLGRGGMATVYLARDRKHSRSVAIKVLHPDLSAGLDADRFLFEISVAAGLTHPNILPLYDSGSFGSTLFYIMPFVDGESLRERLVKDSRLSVEDAVRIGSDVANALDYAHRQGVIHRDIKPENVLLVDGHAVIADFGIARAIRDTARVRPDALSTLAGVVIGTPAYMSPEQSVGEEDIDGRSDIYSLGCLCYEMLVGQQPFPGDSAQAIIMRHITAPAPAASATREDVPEGLDRAILRAMEKEPASRFASAVDFASSMRAGSSAMRIRPNSARGRMPLPATSMVGREAESIALAQLVREHRLVTLMGPGGVGKTRLAIDVASQLAAERRDGVLFVRLASVASLDALMSALSDALGLTLAPGLPPLDILLDGLRNRDTVIVLDNFEQIVDAADTLIAIAASAPSVHLLVTSRERLNVSHETAFELGGLRASAASDAAVQLFVERAKQHAPGLSFDDTTARLAADVCRRVGGLPLAIELAASMLRVISLEELIAELDKTLDTVATPMRDLPDRHRSLHALFESSWGRLRPDEQGALSRLSILRGPFKRELAELIGGAPIHMLLTLVDKSLVYRSGPGRYAIHEVVRRFAEAKLRADPAAWASTEERRSSYFASFLEERDPRLHGPEVRAASDEIATEIADIRAGWSWAVSCGQEDHLAAGLRALNRFLLIRNWIDEGSRVFDLREPSLAGTRVDGRARAARAMYLFIQGRMAEARAEFRAALAILRMHHAEVEVASLLRNLGSVACELGKYRAATRILASGMRIAERSDAQFELAGLQQRAAIVATLSGDVTRAEQFQQRSIALLRSIGDLRGLGMAQSNRCSLLGDEPSRQEDARKAGEEARAVAYQLGDTHLLAAALLNLANLAMTEKRWAEGASLANEALTHVLEAGPANAVAASMKILGNGAVGEGRLRDARDYFIRGLTIAGDVSAAELVTSISLSVADLFVSIGDRTAAIELCEQVVAHRSASHYTRLEAEDRIRELQPADVERRFAADRLDVAGLAHRARELLENSPQLAAL